MPAPFTSLSHRQRSRYGRPSDSAGFTLVELSVVIFLLALFSLLTVPLVTGFGEKGLEASARRLAGTVKYLYNEAALTGRPHRLTFDLGEGTFQGKLLEESGDLVELTGSGKRQSLRGDARFKDVMLPGRGLYSSGEVEAEILPVGWMEETVVHLENAGGRQLTVRLMPFTGAAEIYEGYREFERQR